MFSDLIVFAVNVDVSLSVTFLLMKFLFVISVTVAVTALPIIFPSVHSYLTL